MLPHKNARYMPVVDGEPSVESMTKLKELLNQRSEEYEEVIYELYDAVCYIHDIISFTDVFKGCEFYDFIETIMEKHSELNSYITDMKEQKLREGDN